MAPMSLRRTPHTPHPAPSTAPSLALVRAAVDPRAADVELARRVRTGEPGAAGALFDRFGPLVNRVLLRLLGGGTDHDDRVQEAFLEILRSVRALRDDGALRAWVTTVTVRVARAEIRRRRVRRMFFLSDDHETVPEPSLEEDPAARAAVRATYRVLDAMPTEERLAFALRFLHGEELTDVALACGCSLATVKRRLVKAEARFLEAARNDPDLLPRLVRGTRWRTE